jgi:hypothetical protein
MIRNQFIEANPFKKLEESEVKELTNENFKQIYESLSFHYSELMSIIDKLSTQAKAITDIYKDNV